MDQAKLEAIVQEYNECGHCKELLRATIAGMWESIETGEDRHQMEAQREELRHRMGHVRTMFGRAFSDAKSA